MPVFTGVLAWPTWPLNDDYCKSQLKIHLPGEWRTDYDLLDGHETYTEHFLDFFEIAPDGTSLARGMPVAVHAAPMHAPMPAPMPAPPPAPVPVAPVPVRGVHDAAGLYSRKAMVRDAVGAAVRRAKAK